MPALREAVAAVRAGKVCVVDVRVAPGYSRRRHRRHHAARAMMEQRQAGHVLVIVTE